MPCGYVCDNKTSEGYCKTTACINPKVNSMAEYTSVPVEDVKDDKPMVYSDKPMIYSKIIKDIDSAGSVTDIKIDGEKVFQVYKDGNWEIERIFVEYSPFDKFVVVMSRKEKKDDDA